MRKQIKYKRIAVCESLHKRLIKDREEFQKTIGGGLNHISIRFIQEMM